jgi:hypothetical protein
MRQRQSALSRYPHGHRFRPVDRLTPSCSYLGVRFLWAITGLTSFVMIIQTILLTRSQKGNVSRKVGMMSIPQREELARPFMNKPSSENDTGDRSRSSHSPWDRPRNAASSNAKRALYSRGMTHDQMQNMRLVRYFSNDVDARSEPVGAEDRSRFESQATSANHLNHSRIRHVTSTRHRNMMDDITPQVNATSPTSSDSSTNAAKNQKPVDKVVAVNSTSTNNQNDDNNHTAASIKATNQTSIRGDDAAPDSDATPTAAEETTTKNGDFDVDVDRFHWWVTLKYDEKITNDGRSAHEPPVTRRSHAATVARYLLSSPSSVSNNNNNRPVVQNTPGKRKRRQLIPDYITKHVGHVSQAQAQQRSALEANPPQHEKEGGDAAKPGSSNTATASRPREDSSQGNNARPPPSETAQGQAIIGVTPVNQVDHADEKDITETVMQQNDAASANRPVTTKADAGAEDASNQTNEAIPAPAGAELDKNVGMEDNGDSPPGSPQFQALPQTNLTETLGNTIIKPAPVNNKTTEAAGSNNNSTTATVSRSPVSAIPSTATSLAQKQQNEGGVVAETKEIEKSEPAKEEEGMPSPSVNVNATDSLPEGSSSSSYQSSNSSPSNGTSSSYAQQSQQKKDQDNASSVADVRDVPLVDLKNVQEYMILSGGFTDEDWTSFPVYAFDLTSTHRITTSSGPQKAAPSDYSEKDDGEEKRDAYADEADWDLPVPLGEWFHLGNGGGGSSSHRDRRRGLDNQSSNDKAGSTSSSQKEWPLGRVGHVSVVSPTTHDLYVFGGLTYSQRTFRVADQEKGEGGSSGTSPLVIWKAKLPASASLWDTLDDDYGDIGYSLKWGKVTPQVSSLDEEETILPRGEAAGGLWTSPSGEEFMILYGGLSTSTSSSSGTSLPTETSWSGSSSSSNNAHGGLDMPLGDVWAYSLSKNTFEQWASYPPEQPYLAGEDAEQGGSESSYMPPYDPYQEYNDDPMGAGIFYPVARTAHAATVTSDKLVTYGGMALSSFGGWAPTWQMLEDVWEFDLLRKEWVGPRHMYPPLARSYHSVVGMGGTLVATGGFRSSDTLAGEQVAFVFADTLISFINHEGGLSAGSEQEEATKAAGDKGENGILLNELIRESVVQFWQKAVSPTGETDGIPHRLEHSAVIDAYGSMYVWGGRFRLVSQIASSVYRLDILNPNQTSGNSRGQINPKISTQIAEPDGMEEYEAELQTLHLIVAIMIFMSVLFTTMLGSLRRQVDEANAAAAGGGGVGAVGGFGMMDFMGGTSNLNRRGGVRQDVIDSFPIKLYTAPAYEEDNKTSLSRPSEASSTSDVPASHSSGMTVPEDDGHSRKKEEEGEGSGHNMTDLTNTLDDYNSFDIDYEEPACAICLMEYEPGDEMRTLPCHHDFHKDCVDAWLYNHASCPACRHSLAQQQDGDDSEADEAIPNASPADAGTSANSSSNNNVDDEEMSGIELQERARPRLTVQLWNRARSRITRRQAYGLFSSSDDADNAASTDAVGDSDPTSEGDGNMVDQSLELYVEADAALGGGDAISDEGERNSDRQQSNSAFSVSHGRGGVGLGRGRAARRARRHAIQAAEAGQPFQMEMVTYDTSASASSSTSGSSLIEDSHIVV